jgi:hypothetical protein
MHKNETIRYAQLHDKCGKRLYLDSNTTHTEAGKTHVNYDLRKNTPVIV